MLNIIIGKFLDQSFYAFTRMFQTLQESDPLGFSKIKEYIIQKVGNIPEIISILTSKDLISQETGKIFTPEGENSLVRVINNLI